ncbi:hypothetical protein KSK37_00925 [Kaistella sp. DKR-2]|uniref:hypothetical protein n=1 Tax=Kaistella soli TaxID=2849654 RepID=UPI001C260E98|nr:hypothetical protein [Kaistella soli]MBU8881638.1 hypothetical protein [Kaistella soli]
MKYLLELILATIIIFFLWNILKRMFFTAFYKFPRPENKENASAQKSKKNLDSKINWDAETVDYEEIKENDETKK